jgi:hypothetical protein
LRSRSLTAGPWMTLPSLSKRDPWQGQSQVFSAVFQETMQPRCVQVADTATKPPSSLLYAAARSPSRLTIRPSPGGISSTSPLRPGRRSANQRLPTFAFSFASFPKPLSFGTLVES